MIRGLKPGARVSLVVRTLPTPEPITVESITGPLLEDAKVGDRARLIFNDSGTIAWLGPVVQLDLETEL